MTWKHWLIVGGLGVVALIAAVALNLNVAKHSVENVASTVAVDNSDLKVNWERYQTVDVALTESLNITESGTYHLTGSLDNGQVVVDAGVSEVRLVLDNVTIRNADGPAILCYNAENLVIELVGNNVLEDGASYNSSYDEDVEGVIYSKADLALTGEGSLQIVANLSDGIVGKDDVVIRGGSYVLATKDDGIRGKDSVYITDGKFVISAAGDAIKSTNDTDRGKGFVMIEKGEFDVVATGKGIKTVNNIIIYGGNYDLKTYDDAIHSNNYVGIVGGDILINAGDDGIHADRELIVDGGTIEITRSYEGLEAQVVTINAGEISLTTSDDGINAGGGADNSSQNRAGANPFNADENCSLTINGGNIYVNAAGDGIDSNGYLTFAGGTVIVDGPTNNGNGALDAGIEISMQGGTVIAVGASGMAEGLGSSSGVCNLNVYFSSTQAAGTLIEVKNSAGEVILSHTSAKAFNHMAAGSEALTPGETYTIYLDGAEYQTFTISNVMTTLGNTNTNQNMMPGGGRR